MGNRVVLLLLVVLLILTASAPARAQFGPYDKWEIAPFAGHETGGSYPVSDSLIVDKIRVDSGTSYGTFIDYSLTQNAAFEFLWNRNSTSFSARTAGTNLYFKTFDSDIDQYSFGLSYMFLNSERKFRPYAAGGIGFTHQSNSAANANRTDLSYSLGGGVKYFASRHVGLRGDIRWLPTRASKSPATYCDPFGFCYNATVTNYLGRGNFVGGILLRF
jgi:hypothetical protein